MTSIPNKWILIPLNELGEWGSGGTPKRTNPRYYLGGNIPWLIIGDLNDDIVRKAATYITDEGLQNSSAKLLPINTLLIAMYGSIGKLGITGFECATNQAIAFCIPDQKLVVLKYFFYALMNARDDLITRGQGDAQQNISQTILRAYTIPLAPLNEQKRIADKLDTLLARVDACREHLDRVEEILKRFRQAVLSAAVSGKLTEEWRIENEVDEPNVTILNNTGSAFSYGSSAKSKSYGKIPVLRMGNIQDGKLDWSNLVYTSDSNEINKYLLNQGDVLFNRTNSPELVGKTAVYNGEQPSIYAGYLIRIRCGDQLLPNYLNYCLNSPFGRDWSWRVKSDGVSQSNINAKKLGEFQFLLPSIKEQEEIIRRVEKLFSYTDHLESQQKIAYSIVNRLSPLLLGKAFSGDLVPQDLNDEPASVLLDRIRIARQNDPKETKKIHRSHRMEISKKDIDQNVSVLKVLQDAKEELSTEKLFNLMGYPNDAEAEIVEEFFVAIRDALRNEHISVRKVNGVDWFSAVDQ